MTVNGVLWSETSNLCVNIHIKLTKHWFTLGHGNYGRKLKYWIQLKYTLYITAYWNDTAYWKETNTEKYRQTKERLYDGHQGEKRNAHIDFEIRKAGV